MAALVTLTTGDLWDDDAMRPAGGPEPAPAMEPSLRRACAYIGRFVEGISPLRAIRAKCASCMGGDAGQMPRGEGG
jgi:hypothetical protein